MMLRCLKVLITCSALAIFAANSVAANDIAIVNETNTAIEEVAADEIAAPSDVAPAKQLDVDVVAQPAQTEAGESVNLPDDAVIADIDTQDCDVDISIDMANGETREIANLDTCSVSIIIVEESNEVIEPVEPTVE